jgi:uracil-DNA glycosylase
LVARIRSERKLAAREVPDFDVTGMCGRENAKYLLLLEAPGPKALESGRISLDNPDPSAANLGSQLKEAGISRTDVVLWNIVPWYLGNSKGTTIRQAKSHDIQDGLNYLAPLLSLLPNLRCVVLVGGAARKAHMLLSRITTARIVTCHHPSARAINRNSDAVKENIEVFSFIRATT